MYIKQSVNKMGKAKVKLPIEREGIKCENPEKYYDFGDEIGWYMSTFIRINILKVRKITLRQHIWKSPLRIFF